MGSSTRVKLVVKPIEICLETPIKVSGPLCLARHSLQIIPETWFTH